MAASPPLIESRNLLSDPRARSTALALIVFTVVLAVLELVVRPVNIFDVFLAIVLLYDIALVVFLTTAYAVLRFTPHRVILKGAGRPIEIPYPALISFNRFQSILPNYRTMYFEYQLTYADETGKLRKAAIFVSPQKKELLIAFLKHAKTLNPRFSVEL